MKTLPRALLPLGAALTLPGCVTPPPSTPSTPSALCGLHDLDAPPIPANFTGTLNQTRRTRAANHVVQLNTIETAACATFDRVVFDFDGLRLPPISTVEYISGPATQCGSGDPIPMDGNARLKITFDTAQAHTEAGQSTVTARNRHLNYPNLRHLVVACDFEGKVEIVLGLHTKKPYRAVELLNDSKLVIDIKH